VVLWRDQQYARKIVSQLKRIRCSDTRDGEAEGGMGYSQGRALSMVF
jgi:hypothetical protein